VVEAAFQFVRIGALRLRQGEGERVSEVVRPKGADPSVRVDLFGIVPGADALKESG
jgi:hypothetical protein